MRVLKSSSALSSRNLLYCTNSHACTGTIAAISVGEYGGAYPHALDVMTPPKIGATSPAVDCDCTRSSSPSSRREGSHTSDSNSGLCPCNPLSHRLYGFMRGARQQRHCIALSSTSNETYLKLSVRGHQPCLIWAVISCEVPDQAGNGQIHSTPTCLHVLWERYTALLSPCRVRSGVRCPPDACQKERTCRSIQCRLAHHSMQAGASCRRPLPH